MQSQFAGSWKRIRILSQKPEPSSQLSRYKVRAEPEDFTPWIHTAGESQVSQAALWPIHTVNGRYLNHSTIFFNIQLIRGKITNFQFLTFSNISLGNINSLLNFISLCDLYVWEGAHTFWHAGGNQRPSCGRVFAFQHVVPGIASGCQAQQQAPLPNKLLSVHHYSLSILGLSNDKWKTSFSARVGQLNPSTRTGDMAQLVEHLPSTHR